MSKDNTKFIALIPAYNPDAKIEELVKRLLENNFEIVVVDDGSKEECQVHFDNIEKYCHLIHHEINKGKGRALKTGFTYIKEHFTEYVVVTLDCDGQHTMKDALRICEYASHHPDSFILGSRKFNTKSVPFRSRFGNAITRSFFYLCTKTKVFDTQTGLRAFSQDLMEPMLEIQGERFEYEINVLLYLSKNRIPMKELTIKTIYLDDNSSSHFNPLKDSYRIYKEILKFSCSSIIPFLLNIFLYILFLEVLKIGSFSVILSNVFAGILSATLYYLMNRRFLFQKKIQMKKTLLSYTLYQFFSLIINTILLSTFIFFGTSNILSKIITEIILLFFSFFIPIPKMRVYS